jgi:AcrR family transcriptional regulator
MTGNPERSEKLGLRERKRLATRRNIQLAVLQLTARNGLDQVTIDDISAAAGVSPRTFFNYFPTKEASLIGDAPFRITPELAAEFAEAGPGGDPLGELLGIMAEQAHDDGAVDPELHTLRRAVMNEYPQIFALRIDRMKAFESVIGDMVAARFEADAEKQGERPDVTELRERARVVGLVTLALARASWVSWLEHPDEVSLPDLIAKSYTRLRQIVPAPGSE